MRFFIRGTGCALVLVLMMLCMPGVGKAAEWKASEEFSFVWETGSERIPISVMQAEKKEMALFLPGSCDGNLTAVVPDGGRIEWEGEIVLDGENLDVSPWIGRTARVKTHDGAREAEVHVLRGSAVSSLFFRISEDDWTRILNNKKLDIRKAVSLVMVNAAGETEISDTVTSFHLHGNSTIFGQKKAFQFKLENKASLDGMGNGKTWMLLANWFDISLIRNQITFDLCRELGLTGTPDCSQVDVYISGAYYGTFLLTEKIQLKKERLEITNMEDELEALNGDRLSSAKLKSSSAREARIERYFDVTEPEDITGGFLLEIEKALHFEKNEEDAGFVTSNGMCVVVKEPSQPGLQAMDYITALVNDFHSAALAADGISPATGKAYSEYIDMRSFAAKIIVEEFTANFDVRAGSQFMYKDSDRVDSLLHAGPGWDYDLTYGNKEDGLRYPRRKDYVFTRSSDPSQLYHYLLTHDDFVSETRRVFDTEMVPAVEILLGMREAPGGSALRSLAEYRNTVAASAKMNFARWNANLVKDITNDSGRTFDEAQDYLADWIAQRFDMLQTEWLLN